MGLTGPDPHGAAVVLGRQEVSRSADKRVPELPAKMCAERGWGKGWRKEWGLDTGTREGFSEKATFQQA